MVMVISNSEYSVDHYAPEGCTTTQPRDNLFALIPLQVQGERRQQVRLLGHAREQRVRADRDDT